MLPKNFQLRTPLDTFAVPLELFLNSVAKNTTQIAGGEYEGTGIEQKVLTSFAPKFIVICKVVDIRNEKYPVNGSMVFSMGSTNVISWIPNNGLTNDVVLSVSKTGFTVGTNLAVNTVGTTYSYLIIG